MTDGENGNFSSKQATSAEKQPAQKSIVGNTPARIVGSKKIKLENKT